MQSKTLKRFAKDFGLPLKVFEDPYFQNHMATLDPYYDTAEKYKMFHAAVEQLGGEGRFFDAFDKLSNGIIEDIKAHPSYQEFNTGDTPVLPMPDGVVKRDIYNMAFVDKIIISVDIRKANYQCLRHVDPALVRDTETYEDFVQTYTDVPYFGQTKQLRQVIFGNLNPKRQQKYQTYLLMKTVQEAASRLGAGVVEREIYVLGSDEFVVVSTPETLETDLETVQDCVGHAEVDLRVQNYVLKQIHPDHKMFYKKFPDGKVEFKCVPGQFMPQVAKLMRELPICADDLVFTTPEGLARYLGPIFNSYRYNERDVWVFDND